MPFDCLPYTNLILVVSAYTVSSAASLSLDYSVSQCLDYFWPASPKFSCLLDSLLDLAPIGVEHPLLNVEKYCEVIVYSTYHQH